MDEELRESRADFWALAKIKPEGYPFYAEAERSWAEGAKRHVETREIVVWGQRVIQEWTLIAREDHDPPGAFDQRVYAALSEYRAMVDAEGERGMRFALEELSESLFGARGVDLQRGVLASIERMWLCHIGLKVTAEDGRGRRSSANWIASYEVAENDWPGEESREVIVEIGFWSP